MDPRSPDSQSSALHAQASELFLEACDLDPERRAALLDERCAGNEPLRERVEQLLEADRKSGPTLSAPALGQVDLAALGRGAPVDDLVGRQVGPYHVLSRIGEGGFGAVYLAEQREPIARRVALKRIKLGMDTRQVIARFEAERRTLARMHHPNIAHVLDAGATDTGQPYFVMEYVEGVPITRWCDQRGLGVEPRIHLFLDVCSAVQHAHAKGAIHRDIKPSNVLVAEREGRGVPKMIDFGIAKATLDRGDGSGDGEGAPTFTLEGQVIGTPQYMSPEQTGSAGVDVDTRSDIYSLGVLLYELLTGATPFALAELQSAGPVGMLRILGEREPPRPSTRVSQLGPESAEVGRRRGQAPADLARRLRGDLDWILLRALEKEPDRRYGTVEAFADDLRAFLADLPVQATPPSTSYRFRKFARRNRLALGAAAGVLLALVVGLSLAVWGLVTAVDERDQKELARADAVEALAGERAAREESEATVKFLEDMLQAAQPGLQGREVTVRDALDHSTASLQARFGDRPAIEGRLRYTVGLTYMTLGALREAESHLLRSIEVRRAALGEDHQDTLASRNALGLVLKDQGRLAEAEPLLGEVLERALASLGPANRVTIQVQSHLGLVLKAQARFEEAEPLLVAAHESTLAEAGPDAGRTIDHLSNLAVLYAQQGHLAKAEPLFVEVLERSEALQGEEHPDVLLSRSNLASLYAIMGRLEDAERLDRKTYEIRLRVLGPEHPGTLVSGMGLAQDLSQLGRAEEAEQLLEELLPVAERTLGERHSHTCSMRSSLATVYAAQGRFDESLEVHEHNIAIMKAAFGPEHPETLLGLNNLASCLSNLDRMDEAEELLREVLATRTRVLGESHQDTLISERLLFGILHRRGAVDEILERGDEVLARMRATFGDAHPTTRAVMLVVVEQRLDHLAEGEAPGPDLLELARALDAATGHADAHALLLLARARRANGNLSGAVEAQREALGRLDPAGPDHGPQSERLRTYEAELGPDPAEGGG